MTARSASPTSAGLRYTAERDIASNRHCRDIGSAGRSRSTSARRSARLICRAFVPKIVFDLQLADLSIQNIDLRLAGHTICRCATLKNSRCTVQQLLLPIVDLVRMNPELARQFGDRPIALDRRERHLRLERRVVLLPCPLHVLLLRLRRFLGAGLHLSLLSHFRGPPHYLNAYASVAEARTGIGAWLG